MRLKLTVAVALAVLLQGTSTAWAQKISGPPLLEAIPHSRVAVLFFVASDCLYSDRYFPEMERLQQEFEGRGVSFRWVYPNTGERLSTVQTHQQQFGASAGSAMLDSDGSLTRLAKVHTTPEAAMLVRSNAGEWRAAYHGRIDDRYIHIGLERPRAQHHDLENAIAAALSGRPIIPAGGPAVGCAIMRPTP